MLDLVRTPHNLHHLIKFKHILSGLWTEDRQAVAAERRFLITPFMDSYEGDILKEAFAVISRTSSINASYALYFKIFFLSVI